MIEYKTQFQDFVDATQDARQLSERDRDYIDHKQWTPEQAQTLKGRGQAPIVINRIKPKHDFLLGLERQTRTDPKAYPRTPGHEDDAESVTDALRYVADNTGLDGIASDVFDQVVGEGYGAAIVEVEGENSEIKIRQIPWDRFYYDPHSRKRDFSDASFMGITTWLWKDEAEAMFPDVDFNTIGEQVSEDATFDDKPLWIDKKHRQRPRIRTNEHYFKEKGVWNLVFFSFDTVLKKAEESPFLNYDGPKPIPACPIEANSAYVDRENSRYGIVRGLIDIQDEINHRRSKALHMLSNVTVIREKGVVESGSRMMNQLTSGKADIELLSDGRFEIDRNSELAQGQLALLQEAKGEIDNVGVNATLAGKDERSLSGRAIQAKQAGGQVELGHVLDGHNDWKRRIYIQIWNRIKQFWDEERWIRVTDDESNTRFVGLNKKITGRDVLAEKLGTAPEAVEFALQQEGAVLGPGQLDRVVGVQNEVAMIDIDIILSEAPDTVTLQQETFEQLVQLGQAYGPENVPFEDIIKASPLKASVKEELLRTKDGGEEAAKQARQVAQQQQAEANAKDIQVKDSEMASKMAKARKDNADADAQLIENELVTRQLGPSVA